MNAAHYTAFFGGISFGAALGGVASPAYVAAGAFIAAGVSTAEMELKP